jgi:hypothetical protein
MEVIMTAKTSKREIIAKQLRRPAGANIVQLQKATAWQAHSIRAALTGLRKKGHVIQRSKDAKGNAVYRMVEGA